MDCLLFLIRPSTYRSPDPTHGAALAPTAPNGPSSVYGAETPGDLNVTAIWRKHDEKQDSRKDEGKQAESAASQQEMQAELDRLNSLSLLQLVAEVMTSAFGPGCPGADDDEYFSVAGGNVRSGPGTYRIAEVLMASRGIGFPVGPMKDRELQERIVRLVAEALQELEHASLVRGQVHTPAQGGPDAPDGR